MRQTARAIVIKDDQMLLMHRNKFGQEYYALVGGGIDYGENAEQALHRELMEETGIRVSNPRLVIEEHAGSMYGLQYIYLCDYVSGEPKLAANSMEAQIHAGGQNLYEPLWLPLSQFADIVLLPKELHELLLTQLKEGFPDQPFKLTIPG